MKLLFNKYFLLLASSIILFLYFFTGEKLHTVEDAISKSIPYKVSNILDIVKMPGGAIIFYLSPKDNYHLIGVAFFKGDNEKGWEIVGPRDLRDYHADQFSFNVETVAVFDAQGPFAERIQVVFGQINDNEIKDIKVGGAEVKFVNAKIIENAEGRFYYKVGKYNIVQGLNKNGEIVLQVGQ
ncbi:MAG: hypothetical protein RO469_17715 [Thermincola sp.]|jgi:hypothetical protein|nr:hypothetical protein [Thermincola sp.]MDT3703259.1 hypothetical protein [Thermincola sp.]